MHAPRNIELAETDSRARTCRLPGVSVAQARARLLAALGGHGFTVISELDLSNFLNRRLDTRRETFLIIDACHPRLAQQALAVASDAGLLAPFRFGVWKEGSGAAIATLAPAQLARALGREHLGDFADQAARQLEEIFALLDRAVPLPHQPLASAPVTLDGTERAALKDAAMHRLEALQAEAAGTESHDLQHGLAEIMQPLEQVVRKL
jgi:uncharacterized protein (DUF302 family)